MANEKRAKVLLLVPEAELKALRKWGKTRGIEIKKVTLPPHHHIPKRGPEILAFLKDSNQYCDRIRYRYDKTINLDVAINLVDERMVAKCVLESEPGVFVYFTENAELLYLLLQAKSGATAHTILYNHKCRYRKLERLDHFNSYEAAADWMDWDWREDPQYPN